ncbi:DUF3419 family protein [archaeon]|nr:DUF3419 family protein [archaeon]
MEKEAEGEKMNSNSSREELDKNIYSWLGLVSYSCTNESLSAIVEGLDLQPKDSVLAVAGSGDQAFAMLERGCKVKLVDRDSYQLDLVKLRIEALQSENQDLFFKSGDGGFFSKHRKEYFSEKTRLESIRKNLCNLEILPPQDIFEIPPFEAFSKIYLSNAIDYLFSKEKPYYFTRLTELLLPRGLIYVSNSDCLVTTELDKTSFIDLISSHLKIAEDLTEKAKKHEFELRPSCAWKPIVFQKVQA